MGKVCSKVGAEGYLDACGVPEPMKTEMLEAVDVVEMKRLGGGKISTKSSSKFMPGENIMKLGEQWEIEMPGLGKVTGDFIVEECEVDGNIASQMKQILVRQ